MGDKEEEEEETEVVEVSGNREFEDELEGEELAGNLVRRGELAESKVPAVALLIAGLPSLSKSLAL